MRNKKGFTLIELLAVMTLIAIVSGIATMIITKFLKDAKKNTYKTIENDLKSATQTYFIDNASLIPTTSITVTLDTLIANDYLKTIKDPDKRNGSCDSSLSRVMVTRNENPENIDLSYQVCLVCSKYTSSGC